MQLAGVISGLLIGQVIWTAATTDVRMIRKHGKFVNAQGDIIEDYESKSGEWSVSPTGEIEAVRVEDDDMADASMIQRERRVQRQQSVDDALTEIQDMLTQRGPKADRDKIKEIQKLANSLLPVVKNDRDVEAQQVETNLKAISKCNLNSQGKQQSIKSSTESVCDTRRNTHKTCRAEEIKKEATKGSKCSALDNFLGQIKDQPNKPDGRDSVVKYVENESEYWCPLKTKVEGLDKDCTDSEKQHAEKKAKCDKEQATFETGFCAWRTELTDACAELQRCYESAVDDYNKHVESTKKLIEKLKLEYKSIKKIVCYIDVWMNDKNVNTVDADHYAKCKVLDPTEEANKELDIDYGKVPEKKSCDLTPVKNYPGTTEFVKVEYAAFAKYAQSPLECPGTDIKVLSTQVVLHQPLRRQSLKHRPLPQRQLQSLLRPPRHHKCRQCALSNMVPMAKISVNAMAL